MTTTSFTKSEKPSHLQTQIPVAATLTPVTELLALSWKSLKINIGSFVAIFFIQMCAFIALFGITAVVGILGGVGVGLQGQDLATLSQGNNFLPVLMSVGMMMGVLLLIAAVAAILLALVFQGAMIAIAAAGPSKIGVGEALKIGRSHVRSLWAVGLIGGLLFFGGIFFFIIPGIVFGLLFSFAAYAVVIDKETGMVALRISAALVKKHFWEVSGRFTVLAVINIVISILLGVVLEGTRNALGDQTAGIIGALLNFVINSTMMGFGVIYITTLYQQLRTAKNVQPLSLQGIAFISLLGLIMSGVVMFGLVKTAGYVADHLPADLETAIMNLEKGENTDAEIGDPELDATEDLTQEDWQLLLQGAMEAATASGKVGSKDPTTDLSY